MNREEAKQIIEEITEKLNPHVGMMEAVESWRRGKKTLHDIDFIICRQPLRGDIAEREIKKLGGVVKAGNKLIQIFYKNRYDLDFYLTSSSKDYSVLKLIRTGSAKHNVMLCSKAKERGLKLKADGGGLINPETGKRIAWEEEHILEILLRRIPRPEERE